MCLFVCSSVTNFSDRLCCQVSTQPKRSKRTGKTCVAFFFMASNEHTCFFRFRKGGTFKGGKMGNLRGGHELVTRAKFVFGWKEFCKASFTKLENIFDSQASCACVVM